MPEVPSPDWLSYSAELFWRWWVFWTKDAESVRSFFVIVGGGVGGGIGLGLLWWRTKNVHRQTEAALSQAATAQSRHEAQIKADRERRITDNFTRAVEHLGSEQLEIRLGGVYALEHIARESRDHHWPIIETLTAFVREKGRLPYPDNDAVERLKEEAQRVRSRLPADVQAALTVIGHRCSDHDADGKQLDLSGTNLSLANLEKAQLEKANLSGAFLMHALLVNARLSDAILSGAHLEEAKLRFARLNRAWLDGAHLDGSDLRDAVLDTVIKEATLSNSCLVGADLRGAGGLTQEQLNKACGDERTKLPEGLTIPRCRR